MRLVVDANILVGELLRRRGRVLIRDPRLELTITEQAWGETVHELEKRVARIERSGRLAPELAQALQAETLDAAVRHVAPQLLAAFVHRERTARRRIPRDPDDWPTVALALELDAGIWTQDADFLGCGLPTWTTDTLLAYLEDEPVSIPLAVAP